MSFEMDNLMHQISPKKKPRKKKDSGRGVCFCNSLITRTRKNLVFFGALFFYLEA